MRLPLEAGVSSRPEAQRLISKDLARSIWENYKEIYAKSRTKELSIIA